MSKLILISILLLFSNLSISQSLIKTDSINLETNQLAYQSKATYFKVDITLEDSSRIKGFFEAKLQDNKQYMDTITLTNLTIPKFLHHGKLFITFNQGHKSYKMNFKHGFLLSFEEYENSVLISTMKQNSTNHFFEKITYNKNGLINYYSIDYNLENYMTLFEVVNPRLIEYEVLSKPSNGMECRFNKRGVIYDINYYSNSVLLDMNYKVLNKTKSKNTYPFEHKTQLKNQ